MKHLHLRGVDEARRGNALVMATLAITTIGVLAMGMVSIQRGHAVEQHRALEESRAVLAADAGLSRAYMLLQNGGDGNLGTLDEPLAMANGDVAVSTQTFGPSNKLVRVTSSARVGSQDAWAELILKDNVTSQFVWAAFGDTTLDLDSQAKTDSYDSALGSYASQVVNGSGSNSWAKSKGNVGSNGSLKFKQNALVKGTATPGPGGTVSVIGNASVSGSTANASDVTTFPPIVVPSIVSGGNKTYSSNTTLAPGSYHFATTTVGTGKTVTVQGPATLVFDSFELKQNSKLTIDPTGGEVNIYVIDNFIMGSNTLLAANNYDPRQVHLNLLSDNIIDPGVIIQLDTVLLNSNAQLYGTLYAPNAFIDVESNFELFGALIAQKVLLASNARAHYDEALGRVLAPGESRYARLTWIEMH